MRTSITLDEDVYQLASLYAAGRGITLSAAINEAVRKMSTQRSASEPSRIKIGPNGLPILPSRGRIITSKMIKDAEEDDLA